MPHEEIYGIFELYYQQPVQEKAVLGKILAYIDNHTYTIEVLARSALTDE